MSENMFIAGIIVISSTLFSSCRTMGTIPSGFHFSSSRSYSTPTNRRRAASREYYETIYNSPGAQKTKLSRPSKTHIDSEATFGLSRYQRRSGILQELGELGTSFGIQFTTFNAVYLDRPRDGLMAFWTYDHFLNTKKNRLDLRFRERDFTSYLLGVGYVRREFLNDYIQLQAAIGGTINFIEIDTFRSDKEASDQEFSDITFSLFAKLRLDFTVNLDKDHGRVHRIGPTLFHYFSPNPLGKFINGELRDKRTAGGSLSVGIEWVTEY